MRNVKPFDTFIGEALGDGYTSTCSNCGEKVTSKYMTFTVEPTYTRGGKVVATYTCPKCKPPNITNPFE